MCRCGTCKSLCVAAWGCRADFPQVDKDPVQALAGSSLAAFHISKSPAASRKW